MKPTNLISAHKGAAAYADEFQKDSNKNASIPKPYSLKSNEILSLSKLCNELKTCSAPIEIFDGYFLGYTIRQIGKEFDLLRFSDDFVVNIEMKSPLTISEENKINKILHQQIKNYHYLHAIDKEVYICTFVEDDGLYEFQADIKSTLKVPYTNLIEVLKRQVFNEEINPDKLFAPSNYLISPFTKTEQFIRGEYFLTDHQEDIKKRILKTINSDFSFSCLTADAGTGKTLLLYDIAKKFYDSALVIHCGKLNGGHEKLKYYYKWNIESVKSINKNSIDSHVNKSINIILIDEAQRIRTGQLELIVKESINQKIPIIFSYDPKQYLSKGENKNIYEYLQKHYEIKLSEYKLTRKIRTNPEIASFISNLRKIGSDDVKYNYEDITVEYFDDLEEISLYIQYLSRTKKWKFITYTNSQYHTDPIYKISQLSHTKAHDVIGQEFDKVVFIMDTNFAYGESNTLKYNPNGYYDLSGMFYQIITRAVSNLKIIVYQNKPLYYKLLYVKSLGMNNN